MGLIRIDHHPKRRQLNVFGAIWLLFFGVVAVTVFARTRSVTAAGLIGCLAVFVPAIGWIAPGFMRLAYIGMAYLAYPIGLLVSFLLLAGVYYFVLAPIGLVMRVVGYDPLNRRFEPAASSYWIERHREPKLEEYFRQT